VQGGDIPGVCAWGDAIQEVGSGRRLYIAGTRDIADFIDALIADKSELPGRRGL
jgi:hypothetical protein